MFWSAPCKTFLLIFFFVLNLGNYKKENAIFVSESIHNGVEINLTTFPKLDDRGMHKGKENAQIVHKYNFDPNMDADLDLNMERDDAGSGADLDHGMEHDNAESEADLDPKMEPKSDLEMEVDLDLGKTFSSPLKKEPNFDSKMERRLALKPELNFDPKKKGAFDPDMEPYSGPEKEPDFHINRVPNSDLEANNNFNTTISLTSPEEPNSNSPKKNKTKTNSLPENQHHNTSLKSIEFRGFRVRRSSQQSGRVMSQTSFLMPFRRQLQMEFADVIAREYTLTQLLIFSVAKEMADCELVICYTEDSVGIEVIWALSMFPNEKQILRLSSLEDFSHIWWTSRKCRGYIFLLQDSAILEFFMDKDLSSWDYHGKYIFAGLPLSGFKRLVNSKKGNKTENLLGLIQSENPDVWKAYSNQLYWGPGVYRLNTWMRNRFTSNVDLFPDKTSNLRGITLKAVIFLWQPSVMFHKDAEGNEVEPYGLDVELMKTLGQVMNFSLVFLQPPKDERWGEFTSNGSLSGMVGMVHRDEADMGSANLFLSITRVNHIDFSKFFDSEGSCVLLRTEPPLPSWQALAFPFHVWTWFSIMVGLAVVGPILYILAQTSRKYGEEISHFRSLSYSWYYIFGMHLNEPQDTLPYRTSTQIFIAFLWLYCIIITIAYSTNLTAFLTVQKTPQGMETIAELPHSGVHVVGVDNYHQGMLKCSPDPNLQSLADTYKVHYSSEEVFRHVHNGKAIFIDNRGYLEYTIITKFTKKGKASLRIMKECFASHLIAMALQNHSPLKKKIDQVITRLMYGGLIRRFFADALRVAVATKISGNAGDQPGGVDGEGGSEGGIVALSLDHMQGIFFIAIFGWTSSFVVFLLERLELVY